MRKFIVVTEPYTRYGCSEPLQVRLIEAEDPDALALIIEPSLSGASDYSPLEQLEEMNGDGADYHLIHELAPSGLVEILS